VHISQALAPIAKLLGYHGHHCRSSARAFADAGRFPDVTVIAEVADTALPPLGVDRYTRFVALTHDPKIDDPALLHALSRDASTSARSVRRRRMRVAVERLKGQGVSEDALARIHAPIGLDISAVSPPEIAVAIMARSRRGCGRARSRHASPRNPSHEVRVGTRR
jgi:xanthine dehydrogenase accessory factor